MTARRMTVQFRLPVLLGRVAHGTRHMSRADLIVRAVLAVVCLVGTAWLITQGALVWPLVVGVVGAFSLAIDAVELYAAAIVCEQIDMEAC